MNPQAQFIAWTKKYHPQVYAAAVQKVQRKVSLGGLGDDLTSDISFDPGSVSASDDIQFDTSGTNAPSSSTDWSGIIGAVATAIPTVAQSVVQTQAQLQTIQLNAQRAAQGLPPLGSTSLLTGQGISSISPTTLLLVLGIGAFALMAGKSGGHGSDGSTGI